MKKKLLIGGSIVLFFVCIPAFGFEITLLSFSILYAIIASIVEYYAWEEEMIKNKMNDEPIEILDDGTQIWKNSEGQRHRDNDLPAIIRFDGCCQWHQNGYWHRDNNLPARILSGGWCEWWVNDRFIKERQCTPEEIEEYKLPFRKNRLEI